MKENVLTLAVETASRLGSVALGRGDSPLAQQVFSGPLRHSTELLPTVDTLLKGVKAHPTDIKCIIISIGPGSFTGLRIAVATAKAMALSNGTRIVAVNTLDTIAANTIGGISESVDAFAVVLDAKRNQFFIAGYAPPKSEDSRHYPIKGLVLQKILPDCLLRPSEFLDGFLKRHRSVALLGDGLVYHKEKFTVDGITFLDESTWSPKADVLYAIGVNKAEAGEFSDPLTLTPFYLRAPQVTLKAQ